MKVVLLQSTPEPERLVALAARICYSPSTLDDLSGEVRFGSPEDFASAYLPDVLGVFAAAHEAVELHVTCKLTLPLIAEFEAGLHDLIVIKQDPARRHPGARTRVSHRGSSLAAQ